MFSLLFLYFSFYFSFLPQQPQHFVQFFFLGCHTKEDGTAGRGTVGSGRGYCGAHTTTAFISCCCCFFLYSASASASSLYLSSTFFFLRYKYLSICWINMRLKRCLLFVVVVVVYIHTTCMCICVCLMYLCTVVSVSVSVGMYLHLRVLKCSAF